MAENNEKSMEPAPTCMESVNRIVKLPVVESSIQAATCMYGKVKDMNEYTKWGLQTMENTFNNVYETGKPYAMPVVQKLEQPIKKVDSALCSGLDYVESKVPAVKLPPGEILSQLYTSTKDYVNDNVTPRVDAAYKSVQGAVDPALQAARKVTEPAVNLAKPTMEAAYKIVEPVVQPAVDKAREFLHYPSTEKEQEETNNCEDCKKPSGSN